MGYIVFDRSGKVVPHAKEVSTGGDTGNLRREEKITPRRRVPHR